MDVLIYLAVAFALNLPFGMYRARTAKLSAPWFIAIHLPIPLIIAARIALDISWWWVPAGIAAAVVGQVLGARLLAPKSWREVGAAKDEARRARKAVPVGAAETEAAGA